MPDPAAKPFIDYPSGDGEPMAENATQYRWIVKLRENIQRLFIGRADVVVLADNFIYPVEGRPDIVTAPDVYVAIGRPRWDRPSYKVWEEGGIFPQVIFEVLSPSNTAAVMARKLAFYDRHGAEEYYVYDPDAHRLQAYLRNPAGRLDPVAQVNGFVSPRLGVRFSFDGPDEELTVTGPDGRTFRNAEETFLLADQLESDVRTQKAAVVRNAARIDQVEAELADEKAEAERQKAEAERQKAEAEAARAVLALERAEAARLQADAERQKAETERLRARLRAAGLDPDAT